MREFQSIMLEFYRIAGGKLAASRLMKRYGWPVSYQAMDKWIEAGMLPATEYRGDTSYAKAIELATGGQIRAYALCPVERYDTRSTRKAG